MMPTNSDVKPIVLEMTASEDLAAGAMVNIWNSSGAKMRNANARDSARSCHGFVLDAVAAGATGTVYGLGAMNSQLADLMPGAIYYLDTSDGKVTATAPTDAGYYSQRLGIAFSATELAFAPEFGFLL